MLCNILGDELWYRAICIKSADSLNGNITVYFLDWGIEYSVNTVYKMSKEFVYLPATAHKCCLQGKFKKDGYVYMDLSFLEIIPNHIIQAHCVIIRVQSNSNICRIL